MSLEGTKTEKNLLKAFAGESQARNRYSFFAKQAKKEGYEQISALFTETSEQEHTHAKIFFKFLEGRDVEITATYPAGKIGTTEENLRASANGENEEWTNIYPEFEKTAREEGLPKIAAAFKLIARIEKVHDERFTALLKNVTEGKVFEKDEEVNWVCRKCGYVHRSKKALEKCPACAHPTAYFEVLAENY